MAIHSRIKRFVYSYDIDFHHIVCLLSKLIARLSFTKIITELPTFIEQIQEDTPSLAQTQH